MDNYFSVLNAINVNDKTEKKNGLTYLSWAWAWGEVKKLHPDANYTVYQNETIGGMPYFTDGNTCFVKTGVTINGVEHIEFLPVMDYKNRSIPADAVTSFDVNKAIQRSLTKAVARHGLGLYIYAGEDLPENDEQPQKWPPFDPNKYVCDECGAYLKPYKKADGTQCTLEELHAKTNERYGKTLCKKCALAAEKEYVRNIGKN